MIGLAIAIVYVPALFWAFIYFNRAVLDLLQGWGWSVAVLLILGLVLLRRRYGKGAASTEMSDR